MCGFVASLGAHCEENQFRLALSELTHRGPDSSGIWSGPHAALGHSRLSILDLGETGNQPMATPDGRYHLVYNGEIYNYRELRSELRDYPFRGECDSEVVLAALVHWGPAALDRFIGMFSFVLWDSMDKRLFAARDRFGVKPLYYAVGPDGALQLASEIGALHRLGVVRSPNRARWATYLSTGWHDFDSATFWDEIYSLPAGHHMEWTVGGSPVVDRWYDLVGRVATPEERDEATVAAEYASLLNECVDLRFRSDVPVGVSLSGGLDSSLLLSAIREVRGSDHELTAFTFTTGDERYDELPWVRAMLADTPYASHECLLHSSEVPQLAETVWRRQQEPYGGLPTLAYAKLFKEARECGVYVLLDAQGMDEQWAGYDYYRSCGQAAPVVQGASDPIVRVECLDADFSDQAEPLPSVPVVEDRLLALQVRDLLQTKIPRALRYNDRISMAASCELREPFLDHRLVELALRQPIDRKIRDGEQKYLLRRIASSTLPGHLSSAPKRVMQTPQREWLRGPLRPWAEGLIDDALAGLDGWFSEQTMRAEAKEFFEGKGDNSFFVWQWMSAGMLVRSL